VAIINFRTLYPEAADRVPNPIPDEMFAQLTLVQRVSRLSASDFYMLPDAPGDKTAWEAYRAALRDGPAILATRNGDEVTLPDPPPEQ